MSEYQYYEFQAIDRPLTEADRRALRAMSTRARITATSFTNHYDWGDFKGDPAKLMDRWFDLHLYFANWGTRQLMIRWPSRLVDRKALEPFIAKVDSVSLRTSGDHLILDVLTESEDDIFEQWASGSGARGNGYGDRWSDDYWDDGEEYGRSGWLSEIAPLRSDVLSGDLRVFYLLWLTGVEAGSVSDDAHEPLLGIGPISEPLQAFASFFGIDRDLVAVAAERAARSSIPPVAIDAARQVIAAMPDAEKNKWLMQLYTSEPHLANLLQNHVRGQVGSGSPTPAVEPRTVANLRARATEMRTAREQAALAAAEAERERQALVLANARRERIANLARRGDLVWDEVEAEIERRNKGGYTNAATLLFDLYVVAEEQGSLSEFHRRLDSIRERHAKKERFLERIAELD